MTGTSSSAGIKSHAKFASPFNRGGAAFLANVDGFEAAPIKGETFEDRGLKNVIRLKRTIFLCGSFRSTASWRDPKHNQNPRFISDPEMEVSLKPF